MKLEDLRIDLIYKPTIESNYPTKNYVRIEHIPTGITVTKMADSQFKAKELCILELKELLKEWQSKNNEIR